MLLSSTLRRRWKFSRYRRFFLRYFLVFFWFHNFNFLRELDPSAAWTLRASFNGWSPFLVEVSFSRSTGVVQTAAIVKELFRGTIAMKYIQSSYFLVVVFRRHLALDWLRTGVPVLLGNRLNVYWLTLWHCLNSWQWVYCFSDSLWLFLFQRIYLSWGTFLENPGSLERLFWSAAFQLLFRTSTLLLFRISLHNRYIPHHSPI